MSTCVRCGAGTRDTQARPMCRRCACSEPKPAPVASAEGLFGWLDTTDGSWVHVGPMPRTEAESRPNTRNRGRKLVRILDDGAHEAALAAAWEGGREEARLEGMPHAERIRELLRDAREARTLRDIFERHGMGKKARHERGRLAKLVDELLDAAGKGSAK